MRSKNKSLPLPIKQHVVYNLELYYKQLAAIRTERERLMPSTTQGYSDTAGCSSSGPRRVTEDDAMMLVTSSYIRNLETITVATKSYLDSTDDTTRRLLMMCYIGNNRVNVDTAAARLQISAAKAYYLIHRAIIRLAVLYGYIPAPDDFTVGGTDDAPAA